MDAEIRISCHLHRSESMTKKGETILSPQAVQKQAGADLAGSALGPTLMGGGTDLFFRWPLLCGLRLSWHTNCPQHLLGD